MANLALVRAAVDAKLAQLWPAIQAKQDAYAATHEGRYWQGMRTRTATPEDGTESPCDVGTTTPTDQPDPWPVAIRNSTLPMSLEITCYDGPNGRGYVATVQVRVNGTLYERSAQVGPETFRAEGWHVVQANP